MNNLNDNDGPQHPHFNRAGELLALLFAGGLAAAWFADTSRACPQRGDSAPIETALRTVLKDPDKTDQLIKRLESELKPRKFLTDPTMTKNLSRLAVAVEGHVKESLEQRIEHLRDRRSLPADWTNKALHHKDGQSPTRA